MTVSTFPIFAARISNVLCCFGVLNALDLDQARARVCVALATLVAQMASPINHHMSAPIHQFVCSPPGAPILVAFAPLEQSRSARSSRNWNYSLDIDWTQN
jgi:hypothetical protein